MDYARAKEILSSSDMITVTYHGMKIYIENVDANKDVATIHPMNKPKEQLEVPIGILMEQ